ncbi:MAG: hypothetical protein AB1445_14455 [Bacillota bacterium]
MRRPVALALLVLWSMWTGAAPALGSGFSHRDAALSYMATKYEASTDQVGLLHEGMIQLELTAESFWFAKYSIGGSGSQPAGTGHRLPQPLPLPAPPTKEPGTAIEPAPPDRVGAVYGGVYIRTKTGEILEMEEAARYFLAEQALVTARWE